MDSKSEERLDNLTKLAAEICNVPICLISLVDGNRQWFKSKIGLGVNETPRDISFCQYTIMDVDIFEIENAKIDVRFKDNPLVNEDPNIRFYAGHPLIDDNGYALGTLCVIDDKPKKLKENQKRALSILANEIVVEIQSHKIRQESKILEQQLEDVNINTRAILDNTTDGIWSMDHSGKLLTLNDVTVENFKQYFDYSPEIGDLILESIPADFKIMFSSLFDKAINGKSSLRVQEFNVRDEKFHLEVACSPILSNKKITGATFFARSVTQRVESENKIKEAKLIAEQALDFKSQFLANMSHEIRTPMNAMIGFADLLKKTNLNSEQKEYIEIIKHSGEDLLVIINDILDLSKVQKGKMELRNANFNLYDLLNKIIQLYQYKAEDMGDSLNLVFDKKIPEWLFGDDAKLTQILSNLIGNAIKFTSNGVVNLVVSLVKSDNKEIDILFKVIDTGIGLPADKLELIFEDFTQVESSLQREIKGTGLGLSIVSSMVDLMGGEVDVKSTLNKGSEFTVSLKFTLGEFEESDQLAFNENEDIANYKILVCDDVELNRILVNKTLLSYNAKVHMATNGKEGVEMAKSIRPDLILMDLQMPIMDGYKATKIIRSSSAVPIIAMTSHSMKEEQDKCKEVGMNGFMTKPFKEENLINLIRKELGLSSNKISAKKIDKWADLNMPTLKDISDGNEEFAVSLFNAFLKSVETKLKDYKIALENKNLKAIKAIVHMFKSSFIIFDLKELFNLANRIEREECSAQEFREFMNLLKVAQKEVSQKLKSFEKV